MTDTKKTNVDQLVAELAKHISAASDIADQLNEIDNPCITGDPMDENNVTMRAISDAEVDADHCESIMIRLYSKLLGRWEPAPPAVVGYSWLSGPQYERPIPKNIDGVAAYTHPIGRVRGD